MTWTYTYQQPFELAWEDAFVAILQSLNIEQHLPTYDPVTNPIKVVTARSIGRQISFAQDEGDSVVMSSPIILAYCPPASFPTDMDVNEGITHLGNIIPEITIASWGDQTPQRREQSLVMRDVIINYFLENPALYIVTNYMKTCDTLNLIDMKEDHGTLDSGQHLTVQQLHYRQIVRKVLPN